VELYHVSTYIPSWSGQGQLFLLTAMDFVQHDFNSMNWNVANYSVTVVLCALLVNLFGQLSGKFFVTHNVHILNMCFVKCFCLVMYWVQSYCQTSRMLYCGKSEVSDCYVLVKCIPMRGGGNVAAETACLLE
jgi:Na+/citrate or Na+/malate symporter